MNEKRLYTVINKEEPRKQSVALNGIPCTARHCVSELNALYEENQRLLKANLQLTEENTSILNTIRTAYQSERTTLGRNTLKQLMEAIK